MLDSYLATAAAASPLLRSQELARSWSQPSALEEFAVSGLAGHLAYAVFLVEQFLDTPPLPDVAPIDAVAFYLLGDPDAPIDDPVKQRIRSVSEQAAVDGPAALAEAYDDGRKRLADRLAGLDAGLNVTVFNRRMLPLDQFLLTRIIELAVHLDDLAVSLGVPTPAIPEEAADLVVATLARIARGRRGTLPVLRALSRRERGSDLATAF
jgi:uncharacterized protein (TIGR03083 family)